MTTTHNLPAAVTSFIGREREIEAVTRLLCDSPPTTRMVTLTGTGGVGKTRLALEVAASLAECDRFSDGVWLVELGPLSDPQRIAHLVAGIFALQEEAGRSYADVLIDALRPRRTLLVLDNCEHLVDGCAELAQALLRACPNLTILATSREPLGIEGETTRRVPSLAWPDPDDLPPLDVLRACEAVRLFVERATAANTEFALTAPNAAAVAQVCARLDGIPLALELAAARVRALSIDQIAGRIDDRFRLLGEVRRGAPERQRTLEATVAWSYDLLSVDEQRLLRGLSVFTGGWTLDDAEQVCSDTESAAETVDTLARLVEKSLVLAEDGPSGIRWYRMLETIRQFALERLVRAGEDRAIRDRHLERFARLAENGDQMLRWRHGLAWSTRVGIFLELDVEFPNLRAAQRWSLESGQIDSGLRLASALFPFLYCTGYLAEGRDMLIALLERQPSTSPTTVRAWALAVLAKLCGHRGDDAIGVPVANEYLALPADYQTRPGLAQVHTALGLAALRAGDLVRARVHATAAVRESKTAQEFAYPMYPSYLGSVAIAEGNLDEAESLFQSALDVARATDFQLPVGLSLEGLARVARLRGDATRAQAVYSEALEVLRAIGDMPQVAMIQVAMASIALDDGDVALAADRFGHALETATLLGHRESLVGGLEGVARLVLRNGRRESAEAALRLLGAAERLRDGTPLRLSREGQVALAQATGVIGAARAETFLAEGRHLSAEQAVAQAKVALHQPDCQTQVHDKTLGLTPREREVAELLARGYANQQIAETLVIGKRTAEMHVSNLLAKSGVTSRAQFALWATTHGFASTRIP